MNEWMNVEKSHKSDTHVQCFSHFSKPERTSWSLTPQLDTAIMEVSSVKELSLRGNPLRLYRAKHLPLMNWTYGDTEFYSGQTSYLNMKVLWEYVIFANLPKLFSLQWPHKRFPWHRRRNQFHFWGWGGNVIYTTIVAICAACMNINKVLGVKYWGGGELAPLVPLVPTPMHDLQFLYKDQGMYTIHKLHPLATHFW